MYNKKLMAQSWGRKYRVNFLRAGTDKGEWQADTQTGTEGRLKWSRKVKS